MNPLVERLAIEAGFDTTAYGHYAMVENVDCTEELERFAALVARHCAALAYEQKYNHAQKLSNPPQSAAAVEAAWAIEAAFPMPKEGA